MFDTYEANIMMVMESLYESGVDPPYTLEQLSSCADSMQIADDIWFDQRKHVTPRSKVYPASCVLEYNREVVCK